MNTQSNAVGESSLESRASAGVTISATQRMYWSVRRELWENRSIYIAPLAAAAVFLLGFLISLVHLPGRIRAASAMEPMQQHELIQQPYEFAELLLMGTMLVVALFYCLDALHGERRDRSILFWKSLPVSDLTTVLAKASIPVVILPLITFAITVATQWIMLLLSSAVLLASSVSVGMLWKHVPLFQMWFGLFGHIVGFHGFWYAPFYAWLLLVSAWARRAPVLWAALPLLAIGIVEKVAFNTSYFAELLKYQFTGGPEGAVLMAGNTSMNPVTAIRQVNFLISPGLWIGLGIAAAFLAGAARLRRYRDPI